MRTDVNVQQLYVYSLVIAGWDIPPPITIKRKSKAAVAWPLVAPTPAPAPVAEGTLPPEKIFRAFTAAGDPSSRGHICERPLSVLLEHLDVVFVNVNDADRPLPCFQSFLRTSFPNPSPWER